MADNRTYDSVLAAKYLMAIACGNGKCLNTTKVQKLLYMAYGYALAHYGRKIVSELPQAWPFGPVFPKTRKAIDYSHTYSIEEAEFSEIKHDTQLTELFQTIVEKYTHFSASQLSSWSHMPGSPWDKTRNIPGFVWSTTIPDNFTIEYFTDLSI